MRVGGQRLACFGAVTSPPRSLSPPFLPREVARAPPSRRIMGGACVGGPSSSPNSLASAVWVVTCAAACVGAGAVAVAGCAHGSATGRGRWPFDAMLLRRDGGNREVPPGGWAAPEDHERVLRSVIRAAWPDRGPTWPAFLEGGAVLRITDADANNWLPRALGASSSPWWSPGWSSSTTRTPPPPGGGPDPPEGPGPCRSPGPRGRAPSAPCAAKIYGGDLRSGKTISVFLFSSDASFSSFQLILSTLSSDTRDQ